MGSPHSPIISKIFLQRLESLHIENIKKKYIAFYDRYVGDIIIIYNNNSDIGNNRIDTFNSIHQNIKFTIVKQKKK